MKIRRNLSNSLLRGEIFSRAIASLQSAYSIVRQRITFTLLLLSAGLVLVQPCAGQSGTWIETGSLATARTAHTMTLLPNGKVLVAGGINFSSGGSLASAELYDPTSGTWTETGSVISGRYRPTATLLPNGKVLVAGDSQGRGAASAELYDPASGTWSATGSLTTGGYTAATLLPNGKVLVAGGKSFSTFLKSAELYDVGLGFDSLWQPRIKQLEVDSDSRLLLTGRLFQGVSQASGGTTQDSSSNYPIVQLRNIDNSEVTFLPVDPAKGWSDTSFSSLPLIDFPPGPALVTIFCNGIPSAAAYLVLK